MENNFDEIYEEKIIEIYYNSFSKYECLKQFLELIINDIYFVLNNNDINLFNDLYIFIEDKINYLDKSYNINDENEIQINKYRILKDIIEKIFTFNNINVNLSYLFEILNE